MHRRQTTNYFDCCLPHRLAAPRRPISRSCALESFLARAFPPFRPPRRPRATAAGFLSDSGSCTSPTEIATILAAFSFRSRGSFFGFFIHLIFLTAVLHEVSYLRSARDTHHL